MERMLSRMLSFAHPQEPCWQEIDLNQLVEQVLALMGRDVGIGQRHIVFSPCQLPPFSGDDDQIRQLLYNLLTNAIRATASEGKIAIQLLPLEEEKLIILKISDDGCEPVSACPLWQALCRGMEGTCTLRASPAKERQLPFICHQSGGERFEQIRDTRRR